MRKILKESKAITLIALVITIIVLLVLAGVTINMMIGKNGIITKAWQVKDIQEKAAEKERLELVIAEVIHDKESGNITIDEYMSKVIEKNMVDEILEESDKIREIVTDRGFIAKIEDKGQGWIEITILGKEEKLPPRITNIEAKTTAYEIEITVRVRKPEGVTYRYYIRKNGETEYRKVEEGKSNTCKIENLEANMKYEIKVEAVNKQGVSEREKIVTTDNLVTITFRANGGSGGPGTIELEPGTNYEASSPSRSYTNTSHYSFNKWTTNEDGSGEEWTGIVPNRATTYYAQYKQENHSIQYRDNGNGTHQKYCSICGYSVVENHSIQYRDNGNGTHQRYCNICGYSVAENHNIQYRNNGNGTHQKYCSTCGYSVTENHTFSGTYCVCGQQIASTQILYEGGNEYTSVTGGWTRYAEAGTIGGSYNMNLNGSIWLKAEGGNKYGIRTNNLINLTPYRYLKINIVGSWNDPNVLASTPAHGVIDNDTNLDNGNILQQGLKCSMVGNLENGITTIDISGINGSYYVALIIRDGTLRCDKIWLEL